MFREWRAGHLDTNPKLSRPTFGMLLLIAKHANYTRNRVSRQQDSLNKPLTAGPIARKMLGS